MLRAKLTGAVAGAALAGLAGCSVLLDWDGYSGGAVTSTTCEGKLICAPAAVTGWQGPVALYEGPPDAGVPPCADGYASPPSFQGQGGFDEDAGETVCSACSCSPGGACSSPGLSFFSDSMCATPCGTSETLAADCEMAPSCNYFEVGPSTPTGNACTASGGNKTIPSPWTLMASACTPTPTTATDPPPSCGSGGSCLPAPSSSQIDGFCISQSGDVACPVGPYSTKRTYYAGLDDSRDCTECACNVTAAPACTGGEGLPYTLPSCTVPIPSSIPFLVPSGCAATSFSSQFVPAGGFKLYQAPTLQPAMCAADPSGGQPTGTVSPAQPTTFCCTR